MRLHKAATDVVRAAVAEDQAERVHDDPTRCSSGTQADLDNARRDRRLAIADYEQLLQANEGDVE